jgi:hypothetical protein
VVSGKSLDDFVSTKSKNLFSRLNIDDSCLQESDSLWKENTAYLNKKSEVTSLKAVNDTAERAVKLMQDFHGLVTAEEEQKQFLLRCVQEHKKLYPDCKKATLKGSTRIDFVLFINLNKDRDCTLINSLSTSELTKKTLKSSRHGLLSS